MDCVRDVAVLHYPESNIINSYMCLCGYRNIALGQEPMNWPQPTNVSTSNFSNLILFSTKCYIISITVTVKSFNET